MTTAEINTMVAAIGLPYAHYQFPDGTEQSPPFICFFYTSSDDFYADGINYVQIDGLEIEHYCDEPDLATDREIGELLNEYGLTFVRTPPVFIKEERMWVTRFSAEVDIDPPENETEEET